MEPAAQKPQQRAMDFLPANQRDLQEASYWKKFFEFDRFKEGFEWYASFEDLKVYLKQHIKVKVEKDGKERALRVIVPGCGNSDLSEKLVTSMDLQSTQINVESFDYEEAIVQKMQESRPENLKEALNYSFGDCTNLDKDKFKDEGFDVAVDKGTLDAIAVGNDEKTVDMCWQYFNEMMRVLNNKDGTLLIVSLLQPHVYKIILDFFVKENEKNLHRESNLFQVKVHRIEHIEGYAEKQFIKYIVSIKKNFIDKTNPKMVAMREKMQNQVGIRDSLAQPKENFFDYDQAIEKVKIDQQIYMIAPTLNQLDAGKEVEMHCFDFKSTDNQKVPKYTLHVVDAKDAKILANRNIVAIIVPQGRERESVFGTPAGRQNLCSQTQAARCVVIFLGHGHKFTSLTDVQEELNAKILELAPSNCANYDKIPIMSAAADIGTKQLIDLKADGIEGIILQDLKDETENGVVLRQVIYESKYDQIQSECQIVYRDPKKHEIAEYQMANSPLCPKKKGKVAIVNHDYLTSEYHQVMLSGLYRVPSLSKGNLKILHLGTGAGTLPMFLLSQMREKIDKLVTVDNSKDMIQIAQKYFGLNVADEKLSSLCQDGFEYVQSDAAKSEQFNMVVMDINFTAEDPSISPPWKFLEADFLKSLLALCAAGPAFVTINVLCYSDEAKAKLIENLQQVKSDGLLITTQEIEGYNNLVVTMSRYPADEKDDSAVKIDLAYPQNSKEIFKNMLKEWNVHNKKLWLEELDMEEWIMKGPTKGV